MFERLQQDAQFSLLRGKNNKVFQVIILKLTKGDNIYKEEHHHNVKDSFDNLHSTRKISKYNNISPRKTVSVKM